MRILALSGGKDSMACLFLMKASLDCAIYVDTGFSYPETRRVIDEARKHVDVVTVKSDRRIQNEQAGLPSDVVPIDWTSYGQTLSGKKSVTVQSYLNCCQKNLCEPLFTEAKRLGATELVFGQRESEGHKSTAKNGDEVFGIVRLHPIEQWTDAEVMKFLAGHMAIPDHFSIKHSSLDCYDCTAYRKESADRIEWMREAHPPLFKDYKQRADSLSSAINEALTLQ